MLRFYCWITGDDRRMLKTDTPESRKKVSALALLVFIPVIIWFVNGFLMVRCVLMGSLMSAFIVSSTLAILIFLIEKNIIMAPSNKQIRLFRYSLGLVIALLGAIFLDEVIFKDDVEQELFIMNGATIAKNLEIIEKSHGSELTKAQSDIEAKYVIWQQTLNEANREADGTSGSGIKGVHEITRLKLENAEINKLEYEKAKSMLSTLQNKIESDKLERQAQLGKSFKEGALLSRIKALFKLVFTDWAMGFFYLLFTSFFFFIEFLVVFFKNAWPMTNYERRLELIEEIGKRRMEKVRQNDISHFDPGKVNPSYKNVISHIQKSGQSSLFN